MNRAENVSAKRRASQTALFLDSVAMSAPPASVEELAAGLRSAGYLPGESTALVAYLAAVGLAPSTPPSVGESP